MEPRACLVAYDAASDEYTFNVVHAGHHDAAHAALGLYQGRRPSKLKFEARDVGGGFGQRTLAYPEYCALMIAAKATGKPVKWVSSRVEGFLTDTHGRDNIIDGELALDRDGKFLAMRLDWVNDMGAYLSPGAMGHIRNTTTCMTGRLSHSGAVRDVPRRRSPTPRRSRRIAARAGPTSRTSSSGW